ncbi:MAG TPA: S1 RNA-binding domain-containing protein [Patescibacteria group bacterium]|nr:S1 RNA-binding domain-containing protein [Patescibacteria group bacterium]
MSTIKEAQNSKMQELLENDPSSKQLPEVGELIKGKVITASPKEVLLDIDGIITGIVRNKELYQESPEFSDLKPGDEAEATIMEKENEQGMMELSFRFAGHQKTWNTLIGIKEQNQTVEAKVTDANKGGLLVTVNGVSGFLPVSQLSPEYYPRVQGGDKNKILERLKSYVGEELSVKILDLNEKAEKLIVSQKASWEEEQKETLEKYNIGDVIEGKVTAVTGFGVFVEFGDNLEGLIHISELAWQRIDDPADLFSVGDPIKAEIIKIEGSKIFLSSKKLKKDPWENINAKYKVGDIVEGEILKTTPFGLFVKLDEDIHGLAHISELSNKKINDVDNFAEPGTNMEFTIVSIEPNQHRLGLSVTAKPGEVKEDQKEPEEKKEIEEEKENKEEHEKDKTPEEKEKNNNESQEEEKKDKE